MKITFLAAAAAMLLSTPAFAHGDDKPRHGGQVVEVGETLFELVRAPAGISLYVREDGNDLPSAAMTGKLVVTTGAQKRDIALVPAGGNRFLAEGASVPAGSNVGVVLVDGKTQARQTATFVVE